MNSKKFFKLALSAAFMLFLLPPSWLRAQTDLDAIMMPKNNFCIGGMYSYGSWKNYWEGTLKRDNANLGTVSTQMLGVMGNYGVSDKLNVLFNLPYVKTTASAGTLHGQKGLQDLSLNIKWRPLNLKFGKSRLALFASLTGSIPASNYEADFDPLALGTHSKNFMARGIIDYSYDKFFVTASGAYMTRSNITIDRNSYFTTELIYSDQAKIPNLSNYNFRAGYRSKYFIADAAIGTTSMSSAIITNFLTV